MASSANIESWTALGGIVKEGSTPKDKSWIAPTGGALNNSGSSLKLGAGQGKFEALAMSRRRDL